MKLQDIRPQHLNQMYKNLAKGGQRADKGRAAARDDSIPALLKSLKMSHVKAAEQAGVSPATVGKLCKQEPVSVESAEKLCAAFGLDMKKSFLVERDMRPLFCVGEHKKSGCNSLSRRELQPQFF